MQFTNAEKLMLVMIAEMHQASSIKNGINSKLVQDALWSNNDWAIGWDVQLPWLQRDANPPYVNHVVDVLDMWTFIESGYRALSPDDVKRVDVETGYQGGPKFSGFDGNNESEEYSAARFLIEEMGRFSSFVGRDLNSHSPTIDHSRRRLAVFKSIRDGLGDRNPVRMNADEIIEVVST
ncbi:YfbU family protein [Pinirhizobacter sp.]|jgi:hypothetical protein|uniref:YfbU family protein n=1 Tax=Pinirhizobacter sp. TaxID=2950432 RepID=UPI002F3E74ED